MPAQLHPFRRTQARRRAERRSQGEPAPGAPEGARATEVARHRRAGGPEDLALYSCECGYSFEAEVTASVPCPHCGAGQAW